MPLKRRNWLTMLREYVEDTESPRHFWIWAGLFCIGSALQRKVWVDFGLSNLYPNLYIMIVAPPGWCRKGPPAGFAKEILTDIDSPVFVDSPTKRALTEELARLSTLCHFSWENKNYPQAPLALVSKELSSFLAVDPKNMIEVLTDLFDSHDRWDYRTSKSGEDSIFGVCVSCLFASTPTWIAANLPAEAIGGGFTSRFIMVSGESKYKNVPIPPSKNRELYQHLVDDLAHISRLIGKFEWSPEALAAYESWYYTLDDKRMKCQDERLQGHLSRIHTIAIRVAMCLHVAEEDSLIIEKRDIETAIGLLEEAFQDASKAFSAHGRSDQALDTDAVLRQIVGMKYIPYKDLCIMNYRNVTRSQLNDILDYLENMESIRREYDANGKQVIRYIGSAKADRCRSR